MSEQIWPFDIVSYQIDSILVLDHGVYLHDIWVVKSAQEFDFSLDHCDSICSELNFSEDLDSFELVGVDVFALADFVQLATRTQLLLQLVLLVEVHNVVVDDWLDLGPKVHISLEAVGVSCVRRLVVIVIYTPLLLFLDDHLLKLFFDAVTGLLART